MSARGARRAAAGVLALTAAWSAPGARAAAPADAVGGGRTDKIDAVVVFSDRARVTRTRAARCEHGKAAALFEHLPDGLDARTLRGEVREAAEVIGLASDRVGTEEPADPRARAIEGERLKVEAATRAAEARSGDVTAKLERLDAYQGVLGATLAEEIRNPRPATASWSVSLEGLRAQRAALTAESRKLGVTLRGLRRDADRLARELGHLGAGGAARGAWDVTVTIDCRSLGQVTAGLSYVVPGATWQPEYDLDFTPAGRAKVGPGAARLTVGAVVRQSTGEDWTDARLLLSTARPRLGAEAPLPAPLVVDGYAHEQGKVLVQAQERREQIAAGGGAGAAGPRSATLDDKGNAFVLTLPHRASIPADGRPVWTPVDVVETSATAKLVVTPKLDEHVFQVVALKNTAAYPLLDGRVRSYRAGSYVGDTRLRYRGVGEPLEVSLGVDEEVKVERQILEEKDKAASLLRSTKRIARATRAVVTNRAAGAATVEVRDNLPVSKIDDVRVELDAGRTTGGYRLDAERGLLTWSVALAPAERKNVDLAYTIRLPDDWQVSGR
jgi:uncharacterized protein (TIGR02231 family)